MRSRGGAQLAGAAIEEKCAGLARDAREQAHLRHGTDGGQRLAAETHGAHRFQAGQAFDLAGGVAPQGDGEFLARDALAVVFHADEAHAARAQPHRHLRGAGVEGVVDQFTHHGRGSFDHLAGRDLADKLIGQLPDGPARMVRMEHGVHARDSRWPPDNPALMDLVAFLIDFILHVDVHLETFVRMHGAWVYALLFIIVFVETGVVVMPFLPGDSLLFVAGALAGLGFMDYTTTCAVLLAAAILGDQSNYMIGRWFGPKVFQWEQSRFFNRRAFDQAHAYYEKYGGITIIIARFAPFLRTFAPFVAGVAEMTRTKFTSYNVVGAVIWVVGIVTAGYFLGGLPWVKANLDKIIWAMILIPGLIVLAGAWKAKRSAGTRLA